MSELVEGRVLCSAYLLCRFKLYVTPWTVAHQIPLSLGILQARTLEWAVMPSSRGEDSTIK